MNWTREKLKTNGKIALRRITGHARCSSDHGNHHGT